MMAAKPNRFPRLLLSSAAIWIALCSKAALSSAVPVHPSTSTASMMDMVTNLEMREEGEAELGGERERESGREGGRGRGRQRV